ncbi:MAG: protein kinase domain-containing protein [Ktedonobacteraceae bacterium]
MGTYTGQRFGDHRLERSLGEGTFGDVYYAEHVHEKKPAAVKVFKEKLTPDKYVKFMNEVRTVLLRHPNIVPIIDFGIREDDYIGYLVMEYAPKGTLRQCYPKGTRLPLSTIVTYVKQITAALQYAHDHRRIHRDVKPGNLLFGANNDLLLSDFGLVVVAHTASSQRTEGIGGSPAYMAPEQWRGKPLPASDQYALGVIVYEWLCGECPFRGDTVYELMIQHTQVSPPPLRNKVPTISPEVEQVVMKTLEKDPQKRFRSAQEFAKALEACIKPPLGNALLTYRGHSEWVGAIAWSPDGKHIGSVDGSDHTVQIWDAMTGAIILTYRGHSEWVGDVAWSPDGKRIASGDHTVQIWDATTGANILTYREGFGLKNAIVWSPNGKSIASADGSDHTVQIWDAMTGANVLTYRGHSDWVWSAEWSADGKRIVSGGNDSTVQIWDAMTGANILTYRGHSGYQVYAVAWSPDGTCIASGGSDKTIQIWKAV